MTGEANFPGRISADRAVCIGAGNCVEQADDYFDQDEDEGKVIVIQESFPSEDRARLQGAANVCPVAAIKLLGA